MEEQVKARLIGAAVLVVIAVALVPELLSGPKRYAEDGTNAAGKRGTRTYTIDLSGGSGDGKAVLLPTPAAESREGTPRLPTVAPPGSSASVQEEAPAAAAESVATVAQGVALEKIEQPVAPPPAVAKPPATQASAPAARPESAVAATQGGWAVQVGAFGSVATAQKLVADLKRDGYPAYVAPLTRSGKTLHRVRVGPQPNRVDADKLAVRLKGKGLPASVVAAD